MSSVTWTALLAVCWFISGCSNTSENANSASVSHRLLAITRHNSDSANLSEQEADSILRSATDILTRNDGPAKNGDGDVPCQLTLSRTSSVTTLAPARGANIVKDPETFNKVCNLDEGFIHVVAQIRYCSGVHKNEGFYGCADLDGRCMIITRPAGNLRADQEGILWAHEYAHTKGQTHPCTECEDKYSDRLMNPIIEDGHTIIGPKECTAIKRN